MKPHWSQRISWICSGGLAARSNSVRSAALHKGHCSTGSSATAKILKRSFIDRRDELVRDQFIDEGDKLAGGNIEDFRDVGKRMAAVAISKDIHAHAHRGVDAAGAKRRIKAALAHLRLAENGGAIARFALDRGEAVAQDFEAALQAGRRDQREVVFRRVIFGILGVFGTHDGDDGQIDTRRAVLALVAAAGEEIIALVIRRALLEYALRNPIGQAVALARRQIGISALVADASDVEAGDHMHLEVCEMAAEIEDGTYRLGDKDKTIGVAPVLSLSRPFGERRSHDRP